MKNETFKGSVIQGLCAIIAAVLSVALGGAGIAYYIHSINSNTMVYDNREEKVVNGNVYVDKSSYISHDAYINNISIENELGIAYVACRKEDFDTAYQIFKDKEDQVALVNLGYIYANGLSYVGEDIRRAEECYINADCIEADRNLLILYLKNEMVDEMINKCKELLWLTDDAATWDYITNCLYQETWMEYQEETGCTKEEFSFDLNRLYEWEYIDEYYTGFNPPSDTVIMQWVLQGVDFETSDERFHPYCIYRAQMRVYAIDVQMMEKMYYEDDMKLYPLDIQSKVK